MKSKPIGGGVPMDFKDSTITRSQVDGPGIIEAVKSVIQRYVIMSESQALLCSLWIPHTYLFPEYRGSTGYMHITSPVPECGKSQLVEVLELFVASPLSIGGATPAALVRIIDKDNPTLLFDEADLNFQDKEMSALLCGIFNNGWRPGKPYIKCEGEKHEVRTFNVFGPKAIAGIGTHYLQPATVTRCFPIRLQRHGGARMADEYYFDTAEAEALPIRRQLALWASQRKSHWLRNNRPVGVPGWLHSRKKSISFPLFAIANDLGGAYTERLSAALEEIFIGPNSGKSRLDYKLQLLFDILHVFDDSEKDVLESHDLLRGLCEIETSPWAEASNGKPLSPTRLALLLSDFGPAPRQHWLPRENRKIRGYAREEFQEAWARYLPGRADTPLFDPVGAVEPAIHAGQMHISNPVGEVVPTIPENAESANIHAGSTGSTTLKTGDAGTNGEKQGELPLSEAAHQEQFRCDTCGTRFDTSVGHARHKLSCTA